MDAEELDRLKQRYANVREKHGRHVAREWWRITMHRAFDIEPPTGDLNAFYAEHKDGVHQPTADPMSRLSYGAYRNRTGCDMWEFYCNADQHKETCSRMAEEFAASQAHCIEPAHDEQGAAIH
ncbi:hypothetical protein LGM35_06465 [Burkholderia cenocepacia]|uniref:hypothetical protein n=1 Tax=Burkholderia cenocepacia TaxID=95486 RepID=UPI001CF5B81C|nr:hypothetical protein [Burkholderia cenocepacia]MCA7922124.1 hypothetical protein [Burkholderia cenocepacia]